MLASTQPFRKIYSYYNARSSLRSQAVPVATRRNWAGNLERGSRDSQFRCEQRITISSNTTVPSKRERNRSGNSVPAAVGACERHCVVPLHALSLVESDRGASPGSKHRRLRDGPQRL